MLQRNRNTDYQIDIIKKAFTLWKQKYEKERFDEWLIHNRPVQLNEFRKVWAIIMSEFYKELKDNRDGVQLLYFLGDMYIGETPTNTKKREFDKEMFGEKVYYKAYNKYGGIGKLIHSIGKKNSFKLHELFKFKPCRDLERYCKKTFLEKPNFFKTSQEKYKRYKP